MTKQSIELLYGRGALTVDLPQNAQATVIEKPPFPAIQSADSVFQRAMDNPIGSGTLDELCQGCRSACILICDITRPVPNHVFLQKMIKVMLEQGIAAQNITVLVATGLHRPNEGDELAELVGDPWVLETVSVVNHFAMNDDDHVDLGATRSRATPVKLDRRFIEADLRIATGLVEPHFMAGYSGGRKVVAPGVAHHETIRTFHSARFMEDPAATQCNLDHNPLHEEQLEIIRMLGDVYALNTIIDDERNLVYASFGEVIASHLDAVDYVRAFTEIDVGRRFNTVVSSSAGFPLDQTYYQTVKAMVTPLDILEPGGNLIIASQCSEGIGSSHYRQAQQKLVSLGPDAFLNTLLAKQLADVDEWQAEMQLKPMAKGNVFLYATGLNSDDHALTGVESIDNIEQAISQSMKQHNDPDIAIIPEGPYIVPLSRSAQA
ncbi:MAG: nickel-dependent lactate racemase [Granulosicoccus sp.]|nr:nickel-dependent lactate racemase [Granulosicoccus sp.]